MFETIDKSLGYTDYHFHYAEQVGNYNDLKNLLGNSAALTAPGAPATDVPPPKSLADITAMSEDAPSTTSIAAVPDKLVSDDRALISQIMLMDSLVSVLTAVELYGRHPAPYKISDPLQAAEFTKALAEARAFVLSGGSNPVVSRFMSTPSSVAQTQTLHTTTATFHLDLLKALFASFQLPASSLTQLDSILTAVAGSLKNIKLSFTKQTQTVDHFISYYYFKKVEGAPDLRTVSMRMFYLHIDQASWEVAISNKASAASFDFNLNYDDIESTMLSDQVASHSASINKIIDTLLGGETETIKKMKQRIKAITTPPQD